MSRQCSECNRRINFVRGWDGTAVKWAPFNEDDGTRHRCQEQYGIDGARVRVDEEATRDVS